MVNLKDYVCTIPFEHFQIHHNENWVCCPHWLTKDLPFNGSLKDDWNSDDIIDIRKSVIDGTYKYCDCKSCPFLGELVNFGQGNLGPIKHKTELSQKIKKYYDSQEGLISEGPINVQFNFDYTCNYQCPSCRDKINVATGDSLNFIKKRIIEAEDAFSHSIETLYSSTTGDPFSSPTIRNYLRNFEPKKYPVLKNIHLHTNASLWNEKMWNTMPNIQRYVKTCEISIDAATKNTYENCTRIGGDWDNLINNLKFISSINTIHRIKCSFVVQSENYSEMKDFVELIKTIFGKRGSVFFCRLQNWGVMSDSNYSIREIHNPNHPEHSNFIKEFNKVCFDDYVYHNLHEFMDVKKRII